MPRLADQALPLQDWTVLSLRPRGQHASLRAACARFGTRLLALSPIAIRQLDDAQTRCELEAALAADIVVFTSPNAVRAASALTVLHARPAQCWLGVGEGTRRALQRAAVSAASPPRMDSEGLLGMPQLAAVNGQRIGLVTAPGGRGKLQPALQARGAHVLRANVYAREAVALTTASRQALDAALQEPRHVLLALSSAEALLALLSQIPPHSLHRIALVAASERLAQLAREAAFTRVTVATDARPASLLRAAAGAFV